MEKDLQAWSCGRRLFKLSAFPWTGYLQSFRQWWEQGFDSFATRDLKTKWSSAITVVAWFIWTERNARIFRGMATSVASLMRKLADELFEWKATGINGALLLSPIQR